MKHANNIFSLISFVTLITLNSCKKNWLDAKPEKSLKVPVSIQDYQAMLDQADASQAMNIQSAYGEIGAGDFYLTDSRYNPCPQEEKNVYLWKPDIYQNTQPVSGVWNNNYKRIFVSNAVLEGVEKIQPTNNPEQVQWNQVKGGALFYRACNHYFLAQDFCKPYEQSSANTDLGIPIRLTSDFNVKSERSTVEKTYIQITTDLKQAFLLLPIISPSNTTYKLRPTKTAATAMLARVYLSMGMYDSAYVYADKTLQQYSTLMDYNLSPPLFASGQYRIPKFNPEVIFNFNGNSILALSFVFKLVDPAFVATYDADDLRKTIFYFPSGPNYFFSGNYYNSDALFVGLATDEMYLVRAECFARAGNKDAALNDLNFLMQKRWKNTVSYPSITAGSSNEALSKILIERRKELIFRGTRWTDLRRLNKDPQFAVTLSRTIAGNTVTLPPNSNLYVLPIPPNVIALTGMQQNPR